jgi:hypothetical protein
MTTTRPGPYRRRVPRSHRRVMLVLLSAPPGGGSYWSYPVSRAAQVRFRRVHAILAVLELLGWVAASREGPDPDGGYRRFYRLTPEGRGCVLELLGLAAAP